MDKEVEIIAGKVNQYFVSDAQVLEDGTLRVDWCGTTETAFCTGFKDILPDSPDYKFWLWLTQKLKRRWYQIGALPGLKEEAIAKFRQEYVQECSL